MLFELTFDCFLLRFCTDIHSQNTISVAVTVVMLRLYLFPSRSLSGIVETLASKSIAQDNKTYALGVYCYLASIILL